MGQGWDGLQWALERHGCVLCGLATEKDGGEVLEKVVGAVVVDFPWVLEKLAGELELEGGGEVLGHDVAQSGLWRGGGQLSVEEPGQRLALEAEGRGSGGLKMVLVKGLEEKVVGQRGCEELASSVYLGV